MTIYWCFSFSSDRQVVITRLVALLNDSQLRESVGRGGGGGARVDLRPGGGGGTPRAGDEAGPLSVR